MISFNRWCIVLRVLSIMDTFSIVLWLFIGLVAAFYLFFKKKYSYWKDRGVTYLEPMFPLGNLPLRQVHLKDVFGNIYKKRDGSPFVGGFLFATPIVVPTQLDFLQHVLVKDFNTFHERGVYVNEADDPLSAHMFSLDGEKWKSIRSKLSPTFTSGKMKLMFPIVVEVADRFHETLKSMVNSERELELKDLLARFTTDVIGTCAFGIECNSLKNPNAVFRHFGKKVFEEPHLKPLLQLFVIQYPNLGRKLHVKTVDNDVSEFFLNSVRETIDYREKNNVRRNDFMDLLIQLKNGTSLDDDHTKKLGRLTYEEVAAQAFLFYLAGFETSSTAMMFSLYELALNPDAQERGRQEINDVLARHEGKLTYEAVNEMTYIDQIISESLRMYPPVVFLVRKAARDYKVPNSKVIIEKGTEVFIPAYSIHRDPEVHSNPDKFDPDRFSPERLKNSHPMSFLAFGDGPRNCVGLRFGRMQSRIGLITLLKNFRIKPSPKTPIPMVYDNDNPVLSPKDGMHLSVEKI